MMVRLIIVTVTNNRTIGAALLVLHKVFMSNTNQKRTKQSDSEIAVAFLLHFQTPNASGAELRQQYYKKVDITSYNLVKSSKISKKRTYGA